jgi:SAM-dependent methyltransferase
VATETSDYLHGYTPAEQDRLVRQSEYLAPTVFARVDFHAQQRVLEVGCGVGAQLRVLARRFPHLRLTGVDHAAAQLARAEVTLAAERRAGVVQLVQASGDRLPFADGEFDGAFLCWVLEHVPQPTALLAELRRVLAPEGRLFVTEVFNHSLFTHPEGEAMRRYWQIFNDYQIRIGGHPHVGAHLGNLLAAAGFAAVSTYPLVFQLDRRLAAPERAEFIAYWRDVLLSAAPQLLAAGLIDEPLVAALGRDLEAIERNVNGVFYVTAMQADAK